MKKKPDRKWLAALALVVGAACATAAPAMKKTEGFSVHLALQLKDS